MSRFPQPAGTEQPEMAAEAAIKCGLDALAAGTCAAEAFLQAMQERFKSDPDANWEILSQLDQYYRRGKLTSDTFHIVKNTLAEAALGTRKVAPAREIPRLEIPVAREIAASSPEPEVKAGSVLRRRYRIESLIGQGQRGSVFCALDEYRLETQASGQRIAIRVLHPGVAKRADLLAQLQREFQVLQQLSHPHVLRVFEFDRDAATVFFTMELLQGTSLDQLLQKQTPAPLARTQALAILRDTAAAIAHAHSRGVIHGDLNPHNIFLAHTGLRVMGFGSMHVSNPSTAAADHELTLPFVDSGFASCQILEGQRPQSEDDIFSLACIAYLLFSGAHWFPNRTALEARSAGLKPKRPKGLTSRQWRALRAGLSWEREARPADIEQWLEELDLDAAASAPRRMPVAVGLVVIALLLAALYGSFIGRLPPPSLKPAIVEKSPPSAASPKLLAAPPPSAPEAAQPSASAAGLPTAAPNAPSAGTTKIEMATDTIDVPAFDSAAQIAVRRKGSLRGETHFSWWTESGTAKPGIDFSPVVPQLAYIGDGKSSISLSVLLSSAALTQPKSFYVVIDQSEGGALIGARTVTMVTLQPPD
jgi:serine/threonine protein kinase